MRSWQYLSAVSAMAISSSVRRFLEARGSCQLKVGPGAEAKVRTAAGRRAEPLLVACLRTGRNIVNVENCQTILNGKIWQEYMAKRTRKNRRGVDGTSVFCKLSKSAQQAMLAMSPPGVVPTAIIIRRSSRRGSDATRYSSPLKRAYYNAHWALWAPHLGEKCEMGAVGADNWRQAWRLRRTTPASSRPNKHCCRNTLIAIDFS